MNIILMYLLTNLITTDTIDVKIKMNRYNDYFRDSKNNIFIESIIKSIEESDIESFENICFDYDKIKSLTSLQVLLLTKIKTTINKEDEIDLS